MSDGISEMYDGQSQEDARRVKVQEILNRYRLTPEYPGDEFPEPNFADQYQAAANRTEASAKEALKRLVGPISLETTSPSALPSELLNYVYASYEGDIRFMRLLHAAMGLCSEAGEVMTPLKEYLFYGRSLDDKNVFEELGDLMWYVALGLNAIKCLLSDCQRANIAKLAYRYGDAFTNPGALVRDLAGERKVLEADSIQASIPASGEAKQ